MGAQGAAGAVRGVPARRARSTLLPAERLWRPGTECATRGTIRAPRAEPLAPRIRRPAVAGRHVVQAAGRDGHPSQRPEAVGGDPLLHSAAGGSEQCWPGSSASSQPSRGPPRSAQRRCGSAARGWCSTPKNELLSCRNEFSVPAAVSVAEVVSKGLQSAVPRRAGRRARRCSGRPRVQNFQISGVRHGLCSGSAAS